MRIIFLSIIFAFCADSWSRENPALIFGTDTDTSRHPTYFSFIVPNEKWPNMLEEPLKSAQTGALVSVGTERSFITLGMAKQLTGAVFVDRDYKVLEYNLYNLLLIKASPTREAYLAARHTTDSLEDLVKILDTSRLNSQEIAFLKKHRIAMSFLQNKELDLSAAKHGFSTSYLHREDHFNHLQRLIRDNKIVLILGDLSSSSTSVLINKTLNHLGEKISIVDLSNSQEPKYLGPDRTNQFLSRLAPSLRRNSLVLHTVFEIGRLGYRYKLRTLMEYWRQAAMSCGALSGKVRNSTTQASNRAVPDFN